MEAEKPYNLEERTFCFAQNAIRYFKVLPRSISNAEIAKQGVRSSGSVGANFIEANEAFSRKDFLLRIKICRKEAKETIYWLKLSDPSKAEEAARQFLLDEMTELMRIFGAIISKASK